MFSKRGLAVVFTALILVFLLHSLTLAQLLPIGPVWHSERGNLNLRLSDDRSAWQNVPLLYPNPEADLNLNWQENPLLRPGGKDHPWGGHPPDSDR